MAKLWSFFFAATRGLDNHTSIQQTIERHLAAQDTAALLALRDSAFAFVNAINDELVKEGR